MHEKLKDLTKIMSSRRLLRDFFPKFLQSSTTFRRISSKEVFEREARYGAHNYKPIPVALSKGKGMNFKNTHFT